MSGPAKEAFLQSIDPKFIPLVEKLEQAVSSARPDFDTRYSYKMLIFTLGKDFRRWICAISVTRNAVNLRFLYGFLLDDPQSVLRPGTSILSTIDFTSPEGIDVDLVTSYVWEAVDKLKQFKTIPRQELRKGGS
ncbi:MAG: DUF1801 domain-containing protein [Actinobacteria bacterium]|nr:DUF1801 domain-containing protein [Actinomycetota bacterium]